MGRVWRSLPRSSLLHDGYDSRCVMGPDDGLCWLVWCLYWKTRIRQWVPLRRSEKTFDRENFSPVSVDLCERFLECRCQRAKQLSFTFGFRLQIHGSQNAREFSTVTWSLRNPISGSSLPSDDRSLRTSWREINSSSKAYIGNILWAASNTHNKLN